MPGPAFVAGETVALHTIEAEDTEFLRRGRNHPSVRRPLTDVDPMNGEQIRDYFENQISGDGDGFGFLICVDDQRESTERESSGAASSVGDDRAEGDSEDGPTPVGAIHIPWVRTKHGSGMLLYWIAPEHRGNGYVTEATELMLDYAFRERRLAKVYAVVLDTNEASAAVLEKLGFEREGVHRAETFVDGERRDNHRYGILADEWLDD
jgi:RimJ/RimL family protein N-acetyltransferase